MLSIYFFFFFNDTATTEIYTLSLHDALPISVFSEAAGAIPNYPQEYTYDQFAHVRLARLPLERSEEHTSELQSRLHLVCRLLLEKKKRNSLPAWSVW